MIEAESGENWDLERVKSTSNVGVEIENCVLTCVSERIFIQHTWILIKSSTQIGQSYESQLQFSCLILNRLCNVYDGSIKHNDGKSFVSLDLISDGHGSG